VRTYADAKPHELVVVIDSYGLVSLAYDRDDAAHELGLRPGSGVTVAVPK
jgi:S-adenosylmethionine hydrolase